MNTGTTLVVRRGQPADAQLLAAFAVRTFRATYSAHNTSADMDLYVTQTYGEPQQASELRDPAITTLLAEVSGALAAFAQLRPAAPPPSVTGPRQLELSRFYVDSAWHGRGVAQQLMDAVLDAARARGASTLWLGVWERNTRARAFYRKAGFVDVGEQPFVLGADVQTDRVMVQSLTPGRVVAP